jgi:hypothetical protein
MNAVDHPHGGGRGKSKGNVHPVSVWGTPVSHDFLEKTIEFVLTNQYRPKEASRREGSGTRTSTLSLNGPGTTASVGPQRDDCTRRSVEMRIDAGNLYYAGRICSQCIMYCIIELKPWPDSHRSIHF